MTSFNLGTTLVFKVCFGESSWPVCPVMRTLSNYFAARYLQAFCGSLGCAYIRKVFVFSIHHFVNPCISWHKRKFEYLLLDRFKINNCITLCPDHFLSFLLHLFPGLSLVYPRATSGRDTVISLKKFCFLILECLF